jgi:hypothetical protein
MKIQEEEIWNWRSERKTVALRGPEIIIPAGYWNVGRR